VKRKIVAHVGAGNWERPLSDCRERERERERERRTGGTSRLDRLMVTVGVRRICGRHSRCSSFRVGERPAAASLSLVKLDELSHLLQH